jgi:hypothetical protein
VAAAVAADAKQSCSSSKERRETRDKNGDIVKTEE